MVDDGERERAEREHLAEILSAQDKALSYAETDTLDTFAPNPTQWSFINAGWVPGGPEYHQIAIAGPNQAGGKSASLKAITAMHLTGVYPDEYTGPRFTQPVNWIICGETTQTTRDLLVNGLLGPPHARGTGYLPAQTFDPDTDIITMGSNIKHQIDYFYVRHVSGKKSTCLVMTYQQGWQRAAGYTAHGVSLDEEPDDFMFYDECMTRLTVTDGFLYLAFTPLLGETEIWRSFEEANLRNDERQHLIEYTIDECTHLSVSERDRIVREKMHSPMAEARLYGRPVRGQGLVYRTPETDIKCDWFPVPPSWPQIIGIDFPHTAGHFAAVRLAHDKDSDTVYLAEEYKAEAKEAVLHAEKVKAMGGGSYPCAWPHDGSRLSTSGVTIAKRYKDLGLSMLHEHAHLVDMYGKKSQAILPVLEITHDMQASGRFRVFETCKEYLKERRRYRLKDGKPARFQQDHLLNACDKAMMMLKFARTGGEYHQPRPTRLPEVDVFSQ